MYVYSRAAGKVQECKARSLTVGFSSAGPGSRPGPSPVPGRSPGLSARCARCRRRGSRPSAQLVPVKQTPSGPSGFGPFGPIPGNFHRTVIISILWPGGETDRVRDIYIYIYCL